MKIVMKFLILWRETRSSKSIERRERRLPSRKHWMMKPPKKRKTMSWMRKMK